MKITTKVIPPMKEGGLARVHVFIDGAKAGELVVSEKVAQEVAEVIRTKEERENVST